MKPQTANQLTQSTMAPPSHKAATEWFATTQKAQWQTMNRVAISSALDGRWDVEVQLDTPTTITT